MAGEIEAIRNWVITGKRKEAVEEARKALAAGVDPGDDHEGRPDRRDVDRRPEVLERRVLPAADDDRRARHDRGRAT